MDSNFTFLDTGPLKNNELFLSLKNKTPADESKGFVPAYIFDICDTMTGAKMGEISLRVGYNENTYYGGNIGYEVYPQYRGRHYAAKACRLLVPLATQHHMHKLVITCNPGNLPSRRTCEIFGAKMVDLVTLPPSNDMYLDGERAKCLFELIL